MVNPWVDKSINNCCLLINNQLLVYGYPMVNQMLMDDSLMMMPVRKPERNWFNMQWPNWPTKTSDSWLSSVMSHHWQEGLVFALSCQSCLCHLLLWVLCLGLVFVLYLRFLVSVWRPFCFGSSLGFLWVLVGVGFGIFFPLSPCGRTRSSVGPC